MWFAWVGAVGGRALSVAGVCLRCLRIGLILWRMEETVMVSQVGQTSGMIPGGMGGLIKPPFDSTAGRQAASIRWERARQRAAAALRDGAGDGSAGHGWYKVVLAQVEKALKGDTRAAHFIGKAADLFKQHDAGAAQPGQSSGEAAEIVALYRAAVADNPELQQRARQLLARQTSESE